MRFGTSMHIPKTAGVALVNALAGQRRPYFNIFPKAYRDDPDEHRAALREAVRAFLSAYASRAPDAGPGLFSGASTSGGQIDRIVEAAPEVRLVTYLRDPVERAISHYRYCLTPAHPLHEAFAKRFPTLMDFVAARRRLSVQVHRRERRLFGGSGGRFYFSAVCLSRYGGNVRAFQPNSGGASRPPALRDAEAQRHALDPGQ